MFYDGGSREQHNKNKIEGEGFFFFLAYYRAVCNFISSSCMIQTTVIQP